MKTSACLSLKIYFHNILISFCFKEIQRLIAPPNEEYKKRPPNPFKRAGRQNNDVCDSCGEAGNLICCDYCTASFHLSCHDPPLEETDIPMGLWLCHTCTRKEKIAQEKEELEKANAPESVPTVTVSVPDEPATTLLLETESQVTSQVTSPEEQPIIDVVMTEFEVKDSESSTPTTDSEPMLVDEVSIKDEPEVLVEPAKEEEVVNIIEKVPELSPFEELIRVASLLNPKQFELPVEMTQPFPFIGTERPEVIRNGRRVKNKRLVELDAHGCVPLPAKLCFSCSKSCKRAPLISCDYCSLFFHQDCLDPPMTALPAGRWMCPNHPQHFIVSRQSFDHHENILNKFLLLRIGI